MVPPLFRTLVACFQSIRESDVFRNWPLSMSRHLDCSFETFSRFVALPTSIEQLDSIQANSFHKNALVGLKCLTIGVQSLIDLDSKGFGRKID